MKRRPTSTTVKMQILSVLMIAALLLQGCAAMSVAPSAPSTSYASAPAAAEGDYYGPSTGGTSVVNDGAYDAVFFENYGVNPFEDTEDDHLSTFGMDVDTAAYTVARRYLLDGNMPDADSVRTEEFINFFKHQYPQPESGVFGINLEAAPSPFGGERYELLRVGLQAKEVDSSERKAASLVFVVDISGSMDMENRLGLVKQALRLLVDELQPNDEVAIVVYGDRAWTVLRPTPATDKDEIIRAIESLYSQGSTNAEEGIVEGYRMAAAMMQAHEDEEGPGRIYRLILCSDGVANVGATGPDSVLKRVREYVDMGITLSTVGFGMGNFNDVLMEQLANDGDGNYSYVDTLEQARRIFVENLTGMLQVVAKDAKVQVDFNPELVSRYRLLGYENRDVADDDFRDDDVDGGEVGAGHSVTALYEIKLHKDVDKQRAELAEATVATIFIRYRDMDTGEMVEQQQTLTLGQMATDLAETSSTFRLDVAVAEFAELLKESYWAQDGSFGSVLNLAQVVAGELPEDADVVEFAYLVSRAEQLSER